MDIAKDERQEEPNVVPLIDISLVILVMALVISSVAGRLLSLELPKAEKTHIIEAAQTATLTVHKDGACRLGGDRAVKPGDLPLALSGLQRGTVVLIRTERGTRYEHVVAAIDAVRANPVLKVAFGHLERKE